MLVFEFRPRPPFRLDLTAWALRRLPGNALDRWDGGTYRRVLAVGDSPVGVVLAQDGAPDAPRVRAIALGVRGSAGNRAFLTAALEKMLGLAVELRTFYRLAASSRFLAGPATRFRGLKPPRYSSVFEAVLNGIACQQVSLRVGILLLNRLTAVYGLGHRAFPRPVDLAAAADHDLRQLGFSSLKARSILGLARAVTSGGQDLEGLSVCDDETVVARLREIPGVGRWTAQYVALRGLGRLDVFPADDVGGQLWIQRWLRLKTRPGYDALSCLLERWRPYRGLLYFHMLMERLEQEGLVSGASRPAGEPALA